MELENGRAYKYCQWCIEDNNRKVGVYVKKQAQSWLDIVHGKVEGVYINKDTYNLICNILKLMMHPDLHCSLYDGLEDYAWLFIIAVFCTEKDNKRFYETALLEIARKNFKTFNSGVIFIIGLLIEPRFSRFFSVAPDFKLSSELRLAIKKIISVSPFLIDKFRILRDMVKCKITDSEYTPLAYSTDRMDGKLANMFLADEAGALDEYPVEAMRSSQITLGNKLGIIISTQYPNDNNVMIDETDIAKKTLDGLTADKSYFALLYEPDSEIIKKWETNTNVIYQSNPVAVNNQLVFDAIVKMRDKAIEYENKRENYLCKHNNIRYKGLGVEGYVDITKVRECKIPPNKEFWIGKIVYLGVDLSQTDDNTAVAMVCYHEGYIYTKVVGFLPTEKILIKSKREKVDYKSLISRGDCFDCGNEVIDYEFVEKYILSIEAEYGVNVEQLAYDRYNAISSVQKFESAENPIECVEVKQHSSVLHPATKLLYEFILSRKFKYEDNILLEINFQNARCTEDTNRNKYVNKKKSAGKVDMVVSLINAIFLLNVNVILATEENWGVQT